jgi:uncharacterized protein YjbI with pentapeptide repeats
MNLAAVNLSGADLRDANLRKTNLNQAQLNGARLNRAMFSRTRLQGADFKSAYLYETVFANVDLSATKNLETCVHRGPSVLDHRTLARSRDLPIQFLRGCGLSDALIRQSNESPGGRTAYSSCFISYAAEDQSFAEKLHADLQEHGVRCWFAPNDIAIGAEFREAIDEGIRDRERLLLVLSRHSISSIWVKKEVETAFDEEGRRKRLVLFPIRLDETIFESTVSWAADIRRARHIGNFTVWKDEPAYHSAFERLLRDLQV